MLKNIINGNKISRLIIGISSLILPIILILNFTLDGSIAYLNFMTSLWIGFYSCIFLIYFIDSGLLNDFKVILIMINSLSILFVIVFSLMGGLQGLLAIIIKMILPLIPYDWIVSFILNIFLI